MTITDTVAQEALIHLSSNDPLLAPVIATVGPCMLRRHHDYYKELVESIIGQQLSLKAAASIEARLIAFFGGIFTPPATILAASDDELRGVGFSRAKVIYIKDLALHVDAGRLQFDRFDSMSNEEIIAELLPIKGIGEWTAHMFLMFCMARSDVLAVGDLGIKNGIRELYDFDRQPTAEDIIAVSAANHWHPYETVACWYVWRSLELKTT